MCALDIRIERKHIWVSFFPRVVVHTFGAKLTLCLELSLARSSSLFPDIAL